MLSTVDQHFRDLENALGRELKPWEMHDMRIYFHFTNGDIPKYGNPEFPLYWYCRYTANRIARNAMACVGGETKPFDEVLAEYHN